MTTRPSVHVRLPGDLIEKLHRLADEQGVSLNALLAPLIAGAVGWTLDDDQEPPRRANGRGRDRDLRGGPDDRAP